MKYSQIIKITPVLGELRKLRLPYLKSREINKMYKSFEPEFIFFAEEENKLVKKHAICNENGELIINENGTFSFKDADSKREYNAKITELKELETDVLIIPQTINAAEIGDQIISGETIGELEGIIKFE